MLHDPCCSCATLYADADAAAVRQCGLRSSNNTMTFYFWSVNRRDQNFFGLQRVVAEDARPPHTARCPARLHSETAVTKRPEPSGDDCRAGGGEQLIHLADLDSDGDQPGQRLGRVSLEWAGRGLRVRGRRLLALLDLRAGGVLLDKDLGQNRGSKEVGSAAVEMATAGVRTPRPRHAPEVWWSRGSRRPVGR